MKSSGNITSGQETFSPSANIEYLLKNNLLALQHRHRRLLLCFKRACVLVTIHLFVVLILHLPVYAIQPAFIKGTVFSTFTNAQLNGASIATKNGITAVTTSGKFTVRVPPNIYTLLATAPTSCANIVAGIPAKPGEIPDISIGLSPASTPLGYISGRIVNADSGEGIQGALILTDNGGSAISSDIDGRYRLASPSGQVTISITADGFSSKIITPYTVYPFIQTNLSIPLNPSSDVMVLVKGIINDICTGIRIDGAIVVSNAGKIAVSDDGFFSIETPAGWSTLLVSQDGYQFSSRTFFLTPISNTIQNFSLVPSQTLNGLVSGIITNSVSGEALSEVRIESDTNAVSYSQKNGFYTLYTSTCTRSLLITRPGFAPFTAPISFSDKNAITLHVPLTPLGAIAGVVRDGYTNTGIKGAHIALAGNRTVSCTTEADGSYVLSNIAAGMYSLEVSHPCYLSETRSTVQVFEGQATEEQFALGASARGIVQGSITAFFSRRPIPYASVTTSYGLSTTADENGFYSLSLPACATAINVSASGFLSVTKKNIQPSETQPVEVNIHLLPRLLSFFSAHEQ